MSFKRLDPEDFLFATETVIAPMWSNYTSSLTSFYTSSIQQTSDGSPYYLDVYNTNPDLIPTSQIQFSIAYGDSDGSGSLPYLPTMANKSPSRTVYSQFANLLLGEDEGASFNFGKLVPQYFYAIVIDRSHYKQAIMPGSLQIGGLAPDGAYITDNSRITPIIEYTNAGRRYILGSGSFGDGVLPDTAYARTNGIYGYLYPDVGIIILNPSAFSQAILDPEGGAPNALQRESNKNNNNPERLRYWLTQFTLQSEEIIPSNYIFCRAQNHEFNFSTQPNFISTTLNITGSSNAILNDFIKTPPAYITSVGLYNDNNELLAVAKLSKPLKKDFTTEALIRVKLDF